MTYTVLGCNKPVSTKIIIASRSGQRRTKFWGFFSGGGRGSLIQFKPELQQKYLRISQNNLLDATCHRLWYKVGLTLRSFFFNCLMYGFLSRSANHSGDDRAQLTLPIVCNVVISDNVIDDVINIEIGVRVKDTPEVLQENSSQYLGIGVNYSSSQIWVTRQNFDVEKPVSMRNLSSFCGSVSAYEFI